MESVSDDVPLTRSVSACKMQRQEINEKIIRQSK
jgi:hypothetical protein